MALANQPSTRTITIHNNNNTKIKMDKVKLQKEEITTPAFKQVAAWQ